MKVRRLIDVLMNLLTNLFFFYRPATMTLSVTRERRCCTKSDSFRILGRNSEAEAKESGCPDVKGHRSERI